MSLCEVSGYSRYGYSRINTTVFFDNTISDLAKDVYYILATVPLVNGKKWVLVIKGLTAILQEGVYAIRGALNELENRQLLRRTYKNENGKRCGDWQIFSPDEKFTYVDNCYGRDKRLDGKSRALLLTLMFLPKEFNVTAKILTKYMKASISTIKRRLRKLEELGYLIREYKRDLDGQYAGIHYHVVQHPQQPSESRQLEYNGNKEKTDEQNKGIQKDTGEKDTSARAMNAGEVTTEEIVVKEPDVNKRITNKGYGKLKLRIAVIGKAAKWRASALKNYTVNLFRLVKERLHLKKKEDGKDNKGIKKKMAAPLATNDSS